jgi:hydrogenase/urease accessory protein HupE
MPVSRLAAFAASACALVATPIQAHPGHDAHADMSFFAGLVHLLTQPDHLAMLAGAVAMVVALRRCAGPRGRSQ